MEAARSRFEQVMEEHARAQARNGHIAEWKKVFGHSFDVLLDTITLQVFI